MMEYLYKHGSIVELAQHGNTPPHPVLGIHLGLDAQEHHEVGRVTRGRQGASPSGGLVEWALVESILGLVEVNLDRL